LPFGKLVWCAPPVLPPVEPVPLRSPVRVSACGCGESYGVTAGKDVGWSNTGDSGYARRARKDCQYDWKQI
jgi:hypothetical protein